MTTFLTRIALGFAVAAKEFFNHLWCALRDHPYPKEFDGGQQAYEDWLSGDEPFCPEMHCTNCGKTLKHRKRGMRS